MTKLTDVEDAVRGSNKSFNHKGFDFVITGFQAFPEFNSLYIDVQIRNKGSLLFDDRVRLGNPALWTPNPTLPPERQVRDNIKNRNLGDGFVLDPLLSVKETLLTAVGNATKDFTKPRIERINRLDDFLGDTLAQRVDSADGDITSTNATWNTAKDGSGLSANTTNTTTTITASTGFTIVLYYPAFDFSSMDVNDIITAAIVTTYGTGVAEANTDTTSLEMRVFNWGPTVTTADWIDSNPTTGWTNLTRVANRAFATWNQTNNAQNTWNDDAAYTSLIPGSMNYFVVGAARISVGQPTGANTLQFYTGDNAGTTSDPLYTITFTKFIYNPNIHSALQAVRRSVSR